MTKGADSVLLLSMTPLDWSTVSHNYSQTCLSWDTMLYNSSVENKLWNTLRFNGRRTEQQNREVKVWKLREEDRTTNDRYVHKRAI